MSFNAGSRICIGINLAWAELYLCLAAIFNNFIGKDYRGEEDKGILELHETDLCDVEMKADMFSPVVKDRSEGVRVMIGRCD